MNLSDTSDIEVLRAAYAAFNAREIDAALTLMTEDVTWPMAFKGGFVRGPDEIRAYWTAQWSEIDPHVEPVSFHRGTTGEIIVVVQQRVRSLEGEVLADGQVAHAFTMERGFIRAMEVTTLPHQDADGVPHVEGGD